MKISKEHIVPFIQKLYREKKSAEAPQELLHNWTLLSEEEINNKLSKLFSSWSLTEADKNTAIERFYALRNAPASADSIKKTDAKTSVPPPRVKHEYKPYQEKPQPKRKGWIWLLVSLLLLTALGFVGYKYMQFKTLGSVYAITDNIAVRDASGAIVARMDLFKSSNKMESYSKFRALDSKVHYLKYEGGTKEYPTRKVITSAITFWDYLKGIDDNQCWYVNVNYIVDSKEDFQSFRKIFSEISTTPQDNKRINAAIRKTIVSSAILSPEIRNLYIQSNAQNLSDKTLKKTNSLIVQEIKRNQQYAIIACMSNNTFYKFEGDLKTEQYKKPTPVLLEAEGRKETLTGAYRFIYQDNGWYLFDVPQQKATTITAQKDNTGRYTWFKYKEPPAEVKEEDSPNFIKGIEEAIKKEGEALIKQTIESLTE